MANLARPRYEVVDVLARCDEREVVQARNPLTPGTESYQEMYQRHPAWEDGDALTRELSKTRIGHPLDLPFVMHLRGTLMQRGFEPQVDGPVAPVRAELSPQRATEKLKGFARLLGADLVRVGPLNPAFVYSHVGKTNQDPARTYGAPITLTHPHAISIAIGIRPELIRTGPVLSMYSEVMRVYNQLALISTTLAGYIRALGYPARAHIMPNYQVCCPPIAIEAGMGELGRHGVMITKELGSALKLTVVTTELPVAYDPPVDIGVDEFCRDCKICAESCPSGAISHGDKRVIRGVRKWAIKPEACFRVWQETGTDCGVCVASCPWTKPRTPFHRLATWIATKKLKAGRWMSWGERVVYGKFQPKAVPPWFEEPPAVWKKYKRLAAGKQK